MDNIEGLPRPRSEYLSADVVGMVAHQTMMWLITKLIDKGVLDYEEVKEMLEKGASTAPDFSLSPNNEMLEENVQRVYRLTLEGFEEAYKSGDNS